MDVTREIRDKSNLMGGRPQNIAYVAAAKSLDFAKGNNSFRNARPITVGVFPYVAKFSDRVGLFGTENIFLKFEVGIREVNPLLIPSFNQYKVGTKDFEDARFRIGVRADNYTAASVKDHTDDYPNKINPFLPAEFSSSFPNFVEPITNVRIENLGVGNPYIDPHIDVRLYNRDGVPVDKNEGLIGGTDVFYVGIHTRSTKRLPYNIEVTVGELYAELSQVVDSLLLDKI